MKNIVSRFKNSALKYTLAIASFLGSFIVKMMTVAPTVSFWDCGEYIAASYTLGVPHPPGAPLYLLVGRFFSMLPVGQDIGFRVNTISPLVTSLAILLLYLIIVKYLKRYLNMDHKVNRVAVYFGAFIGAMTFAFTDSHWFNSVEAEVYGFSTFLTALVMWLALRWEEKADQIGHEKYILLIAYIIGLSIGVHLLSLLVVFVIALIIYFRYYYVSSNWWLMGDLLFGLGIAGGLFYLFYSLLPAPEEKTMLLAILTLVGLLGIYYLINKYSPNRRVKEHYNNVMMGLVTSIGFLTIYTGIIRGVPKVIASGGLLLLGLIIVVLIGGTIWSVKQNRKILSIVLMNTILILVGYSTYISIPIRSNQDPAIDMNNPETIDRVQYYLEREQYGKRSFLDILGRTVWKPQKAEKYEGKGAWNYFWNYQIKKMYLRYFNWQFVGRAAKKVDPLQFFFPFPLLIGLFGALSHFDYDKRGAFTVLALFLFTGLMIVLYLNQRAPQPRERDYSYTGSFMAFSIWIGIGASEIIRRVTKMGKGKAKKLFQYGIIAILLGVLPLNLLRANYHTHDRTDNYLAWDYGYNFLTSCEENAILFTNGDNDTYPLWYLQNVEGIRKDVQVVNLSLLNSPWYIKHIRDTKPEIKIGMPNDKIDNIAPVPWKEKKVKINVSGGDSSSNMSWKVPPTLRNQGLRVQDVMMLQIIRENIGKRPIYISVSTPVRNRLGLDKTKHLSLEGMAYKLNPQEGERINLPKTREQFLEKNQYRNLDDPEVYYQSYSRGYLQNYRMLFLRLASRYYQREDYKNTLEVLSFHEEKIPPKVLPFRSTDLSFRYNILYRKSIEKRARGLEKSVEELSEEYNKPFVKEETLLLGKNIDQKLRYLSIIIYELEEYQEAQLELEKMRQKYPNSARVFSLLISAYRRDKEYKEAENLLEEWLQKNPQDGRAQELLKEVRSKMSTE